MSERVYTAAVLGRPIGHSLSPVIHNAGYAACGLNDWYYARVDCGAEDLPGIVAAAGPQVRGFSVTMPAKFAALDYADSASDRARIIGSANTLVRAGGGWYADNTDCEGVAGALDELGLGNGDLGSATIIGAGGTARPALWALAHRGVRTVTFVNRSDRSAEYRRLLAELGLQASWLTLDEYASTSRRDPDVVVSTVPASVLAGYEQACAVSPVVDVIYDPWPTPLADAAAARGLPVVGGDVMLINQAYSQFEQFTGMPAPREDMRRALENARVDRSRT